MVVILIDVDGLGSLAALGDPTVGRLSRGKPAQAFGDPDQPHSFTYVPDIARALVTAGRQPSAWGRAWHVPSSQTLSTTEVVAMIGEIAGLPAKAQATPKLILRVLGRFDPEVRELLEMLYEFEEPFVVDGSALESAFGFQATPLPMALGATVDWYRDHFAR